MVVFADLGCSVRVTRETEPEAIDKLQRHKLELEVEIHALEREKDPSSLERLKLARKAIADVEEQLQPLRAAYENEKKRGDEINALRRKIEEVKVKIEDAERRSVSRFLVDIFHVSNSHVIPDTTSRLPQTSNTSPSQTSKPGSSSSKPKRLPRTQPPAGAPTPSPPRTSRR